MGEGFAIDLIERREIVHVRQEACRFHNITDGHVRRFQNCLNVFHHLPGLAFNRVARDLGPVSGSIGI